MLGIKPAVQRLLPLMPDTANALLHTHDGADRSAVAIGIKACLNCKADGFSEVSVSVEQRCGNDHGIGNGVAPVVFAVFIVFGVDIRKTGFACCSVLCCCNTKEIS